MKKFLKQFLLDWLKIETIYSYIPVILIITLSFISAEYFPEHWGKLTLLSIIIVIYAVWKISDRLE